VFISMPPRSSRRSSSRPGAASPARLWHQDRRRQLLAVAELLLSRGGPDGVSMDDLAQAAGVTRPTVYKHFRNRQDLLIQLVQSYGEALQTLLLAAVAQHPNDAGRCLRLALSGLCDTIEQRGAGAWSLLAGGGPDPESNRVIAELRAALMRPWLPRIRKLTGASALEAEILCHLTLAAVRTVIDLWSAGRLSRRDAEPILERSLTALLREFHAPRRLSILKSTKTK
jgi:AcrR family transcriptional regulator